MTGVALAPEGRELTYPPPWWTTADQAEQDLILREFLDAEWSHRKRCFVCDGANAGYRCDEFYEVVQAILDWQELRRQASFARFMRRLEDSIEGGI